MQFCRFFAHQMSNISRISALDGVRGLATLMVLSSHFLFQPQFGTRWWWELAHSGWLGVDLFFVLSGFLITGILLKTKDSPAYFRGFYWRRFLRIFPLYYTVVLYAMLAILLVDPSRMWRGYDSMAWLLAFVPNVAMALKDAFLNEGWLYQTNYAGLSHLWSLAVEEQFYLFWPLIIWLLPRKWIPVLCVFILAFSQQARMNTDALVGKEWSVAAYVLPYCRLDGLAGGSLLATLLFHKRLTFKGIEQIIIRDLSFLTFFGLLYFLVAQNDEFVKHHYHLRGTLAGLAFTGFVYLALCEKSLVKSLCQNAFLRHIGMYSYGLYVFHQLLRMPYYWYIQQPLEAAGLPLMWVQIAYMLLAFAATYALARLSWRFIEKPFLDLK